jgi:hypothetical protein
MTSDAIEQPSRMYLTDVGLRATHVRARAMRVTA